MKVSIVTVTYNCENTISETLASVVNQDYKNKEYVVIDGASKDKTLSIIKEYESSIDIMISEPDKGIFDAMNKSLDYVTGDYVIFINSGDKFVNSHIVKDIFEGKNYSEDLIYGDVYVQTRYGFKLRKADAIYQYNPSKRDLVFKSQGFCHQSLFTKVSALKKERFDLSYSIGADYDTTARVFYHGAQKIVNVGFPIAVFDDRVGGASHYKEVKMYKERFNMFKYNPTIIDWIKVYKQFYVTIIKRNLENLFPEFVKSHREKKYKKYI